MWCVAVVSTYLRSEWFVNRTFGVAPLCHSVYWCGGNISSESVTCRALNFDIDTAIKIKYSFSFLLKPLFHILGIYWCVKKMIWTESGILKCCLQLNFGHPSVKVSTQVSVWAFNKEAVMVGTFSKYCVLLASQYQCQQWGSQVICLLFFHFPSYIHQHQPGCWPGTEYIIMQIWKLREKEKSQMFPRKVSF